MGVLGGFLISNLVRRGPPGICMSYALYALCLIICLISLCNFHPAISTIVRGSAQEATDLESNYEVLCQPVQKCFVVKIHSDIPPTHSPGEG